MIVLRVYTRQISYAEFLHRTRLQSANRNAERELAKLHLLLPSHHNHRRKKGHADHIAIGARAPPHGFGPKPALILLAMGPNCEIMAILRPAPRYLYFLNKHGI
jgi:hypothetical protein